MITLETIDTKNTVSVPLYGLSTDEKPIEKFKGLKIPNGAKFVEIDTQTVYLYDEQNKRWV